MRYISVGSSPLVRGAPFEPPVHQVNHGIIPARAGSTSWSRGLSARSWDHPRSCGEHSTGSYPSSCMAGSSPLVRGARLRLALQQGIYRIIPARAGSTEPLTIVMHDGKDHPRSCGEHPLPSPFTRWLLGSSPLVRGALLESCQVQSEKRIIPARAGSTKIGIIAMPGLQDHPRSCGEHCTYLTVTGNRWGSSPLVRGALFPIDFRDVPEGIIPARAGSTGWTSRAAAENWDHPRSCGEHFFHHSKTPCAGGSSPLVRGAHTLLCVPHDLDGIIPARAGSTFYADIFWRCSQDHPRSCGEH